MEPEVVIVLGVVGIFGLVVLGLAVLLIGGKLRVSRKEVEVSSEHVSADQD
jgi:hypothetical protein